MTFAAILLSAYSAAQAPYALPSSSPEEVGAARYSMGVAAHFAGDNALAVPDLVSAAALMPDNPDPLVHLGYALLGTGEPERALAAFERALALTPDYQDARDGARIARERASARPKATPGVPSPRPFSAAPARMNTATADEAAYTPLPAPKAIDPIGETAPRWTAGMSLEHVAGRNDRRADLVRATQNDHVGVSFTDRTGNTEGRAFSLYAEILQQRLFYRAELRLGQGGFSDYALTVASGTRDEERFGWGVSTTISGGGGSTSMIADPAFVLAGEGWRATVGPSLFLMSGDLSVGAWGRIEAYRGDTVWRFEAGRRYEEDSGLAARVDSVSGFASFPMTGCLRGTLSVGGEDRGRGWAPTLGAGVSVRF